MFLVKSLQYCCLWLNIHRRITFEEEKIKITPLRVYFQNSIKVTNFWCCTKTLRKICFSLTNPRTAWLNYHFYTQWKKIIKQTTIRLKPPLRDIWEVVAVVAVIVTELWNSYYIWSYSSHFSLPLTFLDFPLMPLTRAGRMHSLDLNNTCSHF